MRQAVVLSQFIKTFAQHYPQLGFRGMRQLRDDIMPPYQLVLRLALGRQAREYDLYIVALGEGHPDDVRQMLSRIAQPLEPSDGREGLRVLLAPYFSDEARALCVAAGVGVMDLAGNALLEADGLYLEVTGHESAQSRKREGAEPFRGKSERIVRRLLLEREHRWNMRELAAAANTSLGLASMTTTALANLKLANKSRQGLVALDPGALLNAWSEAYDLRRSPFLIYRSPLDVAQIEARLSMQPSQTYGLTLWSAYYHWLGRNVRERYVALYWTGAMATLEELLSLSRRPGATYLFAFQPYDPSLLWGATACENGVSVVNPLQLYLDLASGDEQEMTLAREVRAQLLGY